MPASKRVNACAVAASLTILLSSLYGSSLSYHDLAEYEVTIRAAAGTIMIFGAAWLSMVLGNTFLQNGGSSVFRSLYVCTFSMTGLGLAELSSVFIVVNMAAGIPVALLIFSISGALLIRYYGRAGA